MGATASDSRIRSRLAAPAVSRIPHRCLGGGAERAHAGAGFAAQVDLAALFVERSLRLLRRGGVLSLLLPVKLWQSLSAGGLRRMLTEESRILCLEDFAEAPSAF